MSAVLRPGSPREGGMLPSRVARARDLCAGWVKDGHTPTLGVCVARRGVIVLHEAFGVLGPGPESAPLDRRALFPVTSISKSITATLAMQLVDDGLLGLNRPAKDYLPEISGDGTDEILVHHLLTHTSGYPFHTEPPWLDHLTKKLESGFELPCPPGMNRHVHRWLSLSWDAPRVAGVGEMGIYSTHNYELVGEIVRRLAGRSLDELARERIFAPLGMNDSYYEVPESESHRVVQRAAGMPFADFQSAWFPGLGSREWQNMPWASMGVFSTPLDLTIFAQTLLGRGRYGDARILSPAAVAAMTRDQIPGLRALLFDREFGRASTGYGVMVTSPTKWRYFEGSLQSLGAFGHGGSGQSIFWVDPARELVCAYCELVTRETKDFEGLWNFDLFQNAITAAVEDP